MIFGQASKIGTQYGNIARLTWLCSFANVLYQLSQAIFEILLATMQTVFKGEQTRYQLDDRNVSQSDFPNETQGHSNIPGFSAMLKMILQNAIDNGDHLLLTSIQILRMVLISALTFSILCKYDFSQMKVISRNDQSSNSKDIQKAYCGQVFNDAFHTLSDRQERAMLRTMVALLTASQIGLRCLMLMAQEQPVTPIHQQLTSLCHPFRTMMINSFFLVLGGNELTPLMANLIATVVLDKCELDTLSMYGRGPEFSHLDSMCDSMLHIFGVFLTLIIINNQSQEQQQERTIAFNSFLVASLQNQKQNQIKVALSCSASDRELQQSCKVAYNFYLHVIQNGEINFNQIRLDVLQNTSDLQIRYKTEYVSSKLSVKQFLRSLSIKEYDLIESFLKRQINVHTLRHLPQFHNLGHPEDNHGKTLTLEIKNSTLDLSYNKQFNILTIDVIPIVIQQIIDVPLTEPCLTDEIWEEMEIDKNETQSSKGLKRDKDEQASVYIIEQRSVESPEISSTQNDNEMSPQSSQGKSKEDRTDLKKQTSFAELVDEQMKKEDAKASKKRRQSQNSGSRIDPCSGSESNMNSSFDKQSQTPSSGLILQRTAKQDVEVDFDVAAKSSKKSLDLYISNGSSDINSRQSSNLNNSKLENSRDGISQGSWNVKVENNSLVKQLLDMNPTYKSDDTKRIMTSLLKNCQLLDNTNTSKTVSGQQPKKISENFLIDLIPGNQSNFQLRQLILKQFLVNEVETQSLAKIATSESKQSQSQGASDPELVCQDLLMSKIGTLQNKLKNNRIFMDMVIHDMRNPTNSIQFGVTETIQMLKNQRMKIKTIKRQKALMINQVKSQIHLQQSLSFNSSNSMMGFDSHSFRHNYMGNDSRNFQSLDPRKASKGLYAIANSSSLVMDNLNQSQEEKELKSENSMVIRRFVQNENCNSFKVGRRQFESANQVIPYPFLLDLQQHSPQYLNLNQELSQVDKKIQLQQSMSKAFHTDQLCKNLYSIKKLSFFSSFTGNICKQGRHKSSNSILNRFIDNAKNHLHRENDSKNEQIDEIVDKLANSYSVEEEKKEEIDPRLIQSRHRHNQQALNSQNIFITEDDHPNLQIRNGEEDRMSINISQIQEQSEEGSFFHQSIPQIPLSEFDDIEANCDIDEADCDENDNQIVANSEEITQKLKVFKTQDNQIKKKDACQVQDNFYMLQTVIYRKFVRMSQQNEGNEDVQTQFEEMMGALRQCKQLFELASERQELNQAQIMQPPVVASKVEVRSVGCQFDELLAQSNIYDINDRRQVHVMQSQGIDQIKARLLENENISHKNVGSQQIMKQNMLMNNPDSLSESFEGLEEDEQIIKRVNIQNMGIQCCLDENMSKELSKSKDNSRSYYSDVPSDKIQLMDQNKQLRVKLDQLKFKIQISTNQNKEYKNIIEIYDNRMKEIEDQDFFENPFFDKVDRLLQNTEFSAKMLSNLISDMLDLAKYEAGTFKFYNEFFDLTEVVQNAFDTVRYQSDKKDIKLDFEIIDERKSKSKHVSRMTLNEMLMNENNQGTILNQTKTSDPNHVSLKMQDQNAAQQEKVSQNASRTISNNKSESNSASNFPSNIGDRNHHTNLDITDNTNNTNMPINSIYSRNMDASMFFSELYGDKNRYTQIVLNFLSNAIHYSNKKGNITIKLVLMEEQSTKHKKSPLSQQTNSIKTNLRGNKKQTLNDGHDKILQMNRTIQLQKEEQKEQTTSKIQNYESNKSSQSSQQDYIEEENEDEDMVNSMILDYNHSLSEKSLTKIQYQKEEKMLTESQFSRAECLSQEAQDQELKFITFRLEIHDTGVGIKEENLNSLFKDFSRLDQSMNKKGTGLGLSICKNLIEKMGGKVDVKSIYGEGTAFKIQLSTKTNPYFANLKNRNTTIQKDSMKNADLDFDYQSMSIQQNLIGLKVEDVLDKDIQDFQNSEYSQNGTFKFNTNNNIRKQSLQINKQFTDQLHRDAFMVQNCADSINFNVKQQHTTNFEKFYATKFLGSQYSNAYPQVSSSYMLAESNMMKSQKQQSGSMQSYISMMGINGIQQQDNLCNFEEIKENIHDQFQMDDSHQIGSKSHAKRAIQRAQSLSKNMSNYSSSGKRIINTDSDSSQFSLDNSYKSPSHQFENSLKSVCKKQLHKINKNNTSYNDYNQSTGSLFQSEGMIARRIRLLQQSSIDEESKDDMSQMAEGQSSTVQVIDKEFKCLLANDCDLQLMIMTHILDDCGVEIVTAINGQDALEKVMESEKKFDFIILDLNMPIMDGYDAAMKIISYYKCNDNIFQEKSNPSLKRDSNTSNLVNQAHENAEQKSVISLKSQHMLDLYEEIGQVPYIVACSAHVTDDITTRCLDIGFNVVLESPISVQLVNSQIITHLRHDKKCKIAMENKILSQRNNQKKPLQNNSLTSVEIDLSCLNPGQLYQVTEQEDQNDEESVSVKSKFSLENEPNNQ